MFIYYVHLQLQLKQLQSDLNVQHVTSTDARHSIQTAADKMLVIQIFIKFNLI